MKKEDIITLPHPSLRTRSQKVGVITEEIHSLVERMKAATLDWEESRDHEITVGLAAVQVNKLLRLFIIRDQASKDSFVCFINPEITKYEGKITEDYEGCLSIKNIYGLVGRYETVRIRAMNLSGKIFNLKAKGDLARILQHEVDHTNAILFIDHIKNSSDAFFHLEDNGNLTKLDYTKDIANNKVLWS